MHWVYILKCENNHYYVGETTRLYTRFWEHLEGNGGLNTSIYKPTDIVAIYKVSTICKFIDYNKYVSKIIDRNWEPEYVNFKLRNFNNENEDYCNDNLCAENNIAECMMLNNIDNWQNIKGGKYTRFDVEYKFPNNNHIKHLPLCKCGLPCDIRKNEDKNYLYFRCAKKNMWDKFRDEFSTENPCKFFMEYTKDKPLKIQENNDFEERRKKFNELFKKSFWLKNVEINDMNYPNKCIGGCNRTSEKIKLTYLNEKRNLCFDCFIQKNEELKNKYNELSNEYIDFPPKGVCLVKLI
jgi:predicted GIY-YIG superfamily endonuclease